MARSADPSSDNHHSPETSGDGADSPVLRWAQVVRGGEPDSTSAVAANQSPSSSSSSLSSLAPSASELIPFSDGPTPKAAPASPPPKNSSSDSAPENPNGSSNSGIGFRKKKPAWNKPSNGVVVAASEGGSSVVMGGPDSWPALSESARASPKPSGSADSTSSLSSKPLADGSVSSSQGHVKINSPRKQASANNANPNSSQNHPMAARPRTMRRGTGGGGGPPPAHSNFAQPPPPPPPQTPPVQPPPPLFSVFPVPPANAYGSVIPILPDYSPRDPSFRRPVAGFVPQPPLVNDPRNSQRRGNFGHQHHGDGAHHNNNYGGRRDQDRGNYGNALDANMQPQRGPHPPRGFPRQPPLNAPAYISPVPMRFPPPVGFPGPDFAYMQAYDSTIRAAPYMPPSPPPILNPAVDPNLPASIVTQIEFYFSDGNLAKDGFLKSFMDHQGWVPISLVANFPRSNIQYRPLLPPGITCFPMVLVNTKHYREIMSEQMLPISCLSNFFLLFLYICLFITKISFVGQFVVFGPIPLQVRSLTLDVQLVLNSLRASSAIEVQDDKIRQRHGWMNWVPTSGRVSPQSGSVSPANSSQNLLASSFQQITLDEAAPSQNSITSKAEPDSEDGPENRSTESQLANGEATHDIHPS